MSLRDTGIHPLNVVISHFNYTLTPTGRREVITELNGRTTTYTYDELYRLTAENITDSVNGDYSATYEYDLVGNREYETVDGIQTAYTYDFNDRLVQTGGTTYTYDDNGNTLTETLDGNTKTYTWDGKNKLATLDDGTNTTSFTYNYRGIRTSKTANAVTTDFIVDENTDYAQVLEEVESGSAVVTYSYGHDLLNQERAGTYSYYHYDGLGSTRALSDDIGTITDSYNYEAFGDVLNQTGSTQNNYLFTGEQFDQSLNQYYLRARYYDQGVGRFTQMDTWMGRNHDPITLHKYLYANADPARYTDPTGMFSLVEASVTKNIVGVLTTMQVDNGFSVFDQLGVSDPSIETARTINQAVGLFMLGAAGVNLVKLLSKKIASHCAGVSTCIRAMLGRVKTPYGTAKQLDSPEAWEALTKAQNGAPLYCMGNLGTSNTSQAQFWSLKDPRTMSPQEFANAFGIPQANANFNFLTIGKLKPGQMAITRQAPGVAGNVGGSIEVVTNPNSVQLEVFHML